MILKERQHPVPLMKVSKPRCTEQQCNAQQVCTLARAMIYLENETWMLNDIWPCIVLLVLMASDKRFFGSCTFSLLKQKSLRACSINLGPMWFGVDSFLNKWLHDSIHSSPKPPGLFYINRTCPKMFRFQLYWLHSITTSRFGLEKIISFNSYYKLHSDLFICDYCFVKNLFYTWWRYIINTNKS